MKRWIACLLAAVMLLSFTTGCQEDEPEETKSKKKSKNPTQTTVATEPEATTDEGGAAYNPDYPEGLTLTIGLPMDANVEDYDTNGYTLWLEEQTGFNLEFIPFHASPTDYKNQLKSMMIAGEELPDILWNFRLGADAYEEYGANGYLYDLAPYYTDKEGEGRVFWDRLEELPEEEQRYILEALTAEDGSMYAYPSIEHSLIDTMRYQVYINKVWLEKLGLEQPNSPETLRKVLEAFRDRDPNGNGRKDEKPLIGSTNASCANIVEWIINMFVYCNNSRYFNVDENNELYLPHITDAYRDALIYINGLIKDGLMYTSAFSMTNSQIMAMLNPPAGEDCVVGIWSGHPTLVLQVDNDSVYQYQALEYWSAAVRSEQAFTPATFITRDCEYPLAAWHLFKVMTTTEGAYRQRYGIKGVDWVDADPGELSFLGRPADLKILNEAVFGFRGNSVWGSIQATILVDGENEACQITEDMGQWINAKMEMMSDCYFYYCDAEAMYNPNQEQILPRLDVPAAVAESDKQQRDACVLIISNALSSFCCGTGDEFNDPTDNHQWAAYIRALEDAGFTSWMLNRQMLYHEQYPERG